jgi:peptide/nickel transport system ATP-binding protein
MTVPLIETRHLKKYFSTPHGLLHAVDDVNISIPAGQTLGVVGESGCGKSTLGRVILRLLEATSGEVLFNGENILNYSPKQMKEMRKAMQIVFQDPFASLNPRMTVSELIAEPMKVCGVGRNDRERLERVFQLMETVGLAERFVNTYPHEMDGGRRQRIGIARALALDPQFIVCDEPVSALDVSIQAQILNLLRHLQRERGLTYMFITHDLAVVHHLADEIAVMYLGEVVEKAPAAELFEHPLHPYTEALLSAVPVPEIDPDRKRILLKGEISSPIDPPDACRFAKRCIYATDECKQGSPVLTEVTPGHFAACKKINAGKE